MIDASEVRKITLDVARLPERYFPLGRPTQIGPEGPIQTIVSVIMSCCFHFSHTITP